MVGNLAVWQHVIQRCVRSRRNVKGFATALQDLDFIPKWLLASFSRGMLLAKSLAGRSKSQLDFTNLEQLYRCMKPVRMVDSCEGRREDFVVLCVCATLLPLRALLQVRSGLDVLR